MLSSALIQENSGPGPRLAAVSEWLLLLLAAPFLLLPYLPLVGLALIAAGWGIRRLGTGRWAVPSDLRWPILLLVGALLIAIVPTVDLLHGAPRFWSVVLGAAVCCSCACTVRSRAAVRWAALLLVCAGAAMIVVSLMDMFGPPRRFFDAPSVYALLPRISLIPGGISSGVAAGPAALFVPIAVVLIMARGPLAVVAVPAAVISIAGLLLTQSRTAIVGVAIAFAVGAVWFWGKRGLVVVGVAIAAAVVGALAIVVVGGVYPQDRIDVITNGIILDDYGSIFLAGRYERWLPALMMIVDMPFTGAGLDTYHHLVLEFYPTQLFSPLAGAYYSDAHNVLLQMGADFGILGLAAFLWLIGLAVRAGIAAARRDIERTVAAALLLGLLADSVWALAWGLNGLPVTVTFGGQPNLTVWAALGILIGLGSLVPSPGPVPAVVGERPGSMGSRIQAVRPRLGVGVILAAIVLLILAAPLATNGARLILHRPDAAQVLESAGLLSLVQTGLSLAGAVAWGPYPARILAAQALLARVRGDEEGELAALQAAARAAPWDPSLAFQVGRFQLVRHDSAGPPGPWSPGRTVNYMMEEGYAARPIDALAWYSRAQMVDPTNLRPYVASAEALVKLKQPDQAAAKLVEGIRATDDGYPEAAANLRAEREALAERLLNPNAPLPDEIEAAPPRAEAALFALASRLLLDRSDLVGGLYAARLAVKANPSAADYWTRLAELWERLGSPQLAAEARLYAKSPPR